MVHSTFWTTVFVVFATRCFEHTVLTLSDEKRLIKRLLKNYEDAGITGRPVRNTVDKVSVHMSLSLVQILDVDEKNQVLTTSVWVQYHWIDHILKWNPNDYSQLREVRVPSRHVWTPDIVLYNYADERLKEMRDAMVIVQFNGSLSWMPPAIYKSSCKIDIKNFPFDEQTCHMKFGSWTYDGNRLDVSFHNDEAKVLLSEYTPSNEWEIIGHPAIRNVKIYPCCPEYYPDLTYFLFLRRNAAFFSYILVLPCVLLASLTLIIFWLPPESPAKMVLGMNIFVAFFLLLLLLADSTPQASNSVPYIGYYYCLNMILITLSSFLSVIVINLYFRGDRRNRVPKYLRTICYFLSGTCRDSETAVEDKQPSYPTANYTASRPSERTPPTSSNCQVVGKSVIACDGGVKRRKRGIHTRFATTSPAGENMHLLAAPARPVDEEVAGKPVGQVNNSFSVSNQHGSQDQVKRANRCHAKRMVGNNSLRSRSLTPNKGHHWERCPETGVAPPCLPNSLVIAGDKVNSQVYSFAAQRACKYCSPTKTPLPPIIPDNFSVNLPNARTGLKHQKHPETCPVCKQHLSALRYGGQQQGEGPNQLFWEGASGVDQKTCFTHILSPLTPKQQMLGEQFDAGRSLSTTCSICNSLKRRKTKVLVSDKLVKSVPPPGGNSMTGEELLRFAESLQGELQDIQKVIQSFLSRATRKDAENLILREWRMLAMVMDRIFFTCYLFIHICAAVYLLMPKAAPPDIQRYINEYRLKHYNTTIPFEPKSTNESSVFAHSTGEREPVTLEDDYQTLDLPLRPEREFSEERVTSPDFSDREAGYASFLLDPSISRLYPYQRLADRHPQTRPVDASTHGRQQRSEQTNFKDMHSRSEVGVT